MGKLINAEARRDLYVVASNCSLPAESFGDTLFEWNGVRIEQIGMNTLPQLFE